ncbi:son of sevenless homolog 1-like isoform X1 [Lingula anatina]|uniref:Son of sevenless homolog 1-like isoform X1 n=1 Tax=Lingula anatina TaxID=7574 RepID=A0A1S3I5Z6_LINAN|nr:son of sevenless homolog 1-like isoform X1 [Lingula anatina]|eukprot:XP_013393700.1 son of sevenless homolog 1-like isoform X1 [Lingula anatina]
MSILSPIAVSGSEQSIYNFESEDNSAKWKSLLVAALQKVQHQVHPSLSCREDALEYIETLIFQLLGMLCSCQPHNVQEVEDRVQKTFPHPIDKWAVSDAQNALEKGKKKSPLVLPVDKIHPLLIREVLGYKVDFQVSLYVVAVLEYIAADILKLAGNYVKNIKHQEITCQDIKVAMCADKVLMDMFFQDDEVSLTVEEEPVRRDSLTYEEIVKDLVLEETQYLRELDMIIKVFRAPFANLFPKSKDLEVIFSNVLDIRNLTSKLLSSLEDTVEMTDENTPPLIGGCFEEIAEGAEFEVYGKYTEDMMKPHARDRLNTLLQRKDVSLTFQTAGQGFVEAVKYVLPKLLLGPIYHFLHYFESIKALKDASIDEEDKQSLEEAESMLLPLKTEVEKKSAGLLAKRKPGESTFRLHGQLGRQATLHKINELQKQIDGWEGKAIRQSCNEFVMEGVLLKQTGRNLRERQAFLFDGLIILCKQNLRRSSVTIGPAVEFRLKEKFYMRKVDVIDHEDAEDLKNAFELQVRDHPSVTLVAKTYEEKCNWMAALIALHTRSMLDRKLDSILVEEEKNAPLRLPSKEEYRFGDEDTPENIVFEQNLKYEGESPLIKGGTLLKLVERLTYHMYRYADPKFVRTFLTTFRSFCTPQELLDLLIERFNIPEPLPVDPVKELDDLAYREEIKRFRKEFVKPIQFRVLNVLRHWVNNHFYDFERDSDLQDKLKEFLDTVKGKAMRKWVESITKIIQRRQEIPGGEKPEVVLSVTPPQIEWYAARTPDEYNLMTLHPIEIARQVTLLEFDLYRAVKPSELVGSVWIKKEKNQTSPNLLKMIHHSTMFTFWLERCIIEADNFEERIAVMSRTLEILLVFQELNNFNGMLEVVSALHSAPVYRLEHTFIELPHKLLKAFDEAKELNSDHFKKYIEKLRSINPPCVPFLGMYLTNILYTEEGNPDFLVNRGPGLINFSKRRKVAEICGEIQQYQNQPYCLIPEPSIRQFFENLNPLEDMTEKEFNDYLYNKSLELEPRHAKGPTKHPRKNGYPLKSPGIKPSSGRDSVLKPSSIRDRHGTLPKSLHEGRAFSFARLQEEDIDLPGSQCGTPSTPSTPLTPPAVSQGNVSDSDSSVFAQVLIGPGEGIQGNNEPPEVPPIPPPLPPRRRDHSSSSEPPSSVPPVPPRPDQPPPPLPPRRTTDPNMRTHSAYALQHFYHGDIISHAGSTSSLFTRRNSDRETSSSSSSSAFVNGDSEPNSVPALPPKTYKTLQRNQSS